MRLKLGDKEYPVKAVDELSLFDMLTLERESQQVGRHLTMPVLIEMERGIAATVAAAPDAAARVKAREEHPDSPWLLAVSIWASRRAAGEQVTFEQAISFPLRDLQVLTDPGDEVDAVDPTRADRRGFAAAADHRPKSAKKASAKASSAA